MSNTGIMKLAIIFSLSFCLVIGKSGSRVNHPSILAGVAECSKKESIDVQTLFQALKTDEKDDKLLNYNYCIMDTVGLVGSDGTPDLKIGEEYTKYMFPEVLDEVLKTCYSARGEKMDVAWRINKCLSNLKLFD